MFNVYKYSAYLAVCCAYFFGLHAEEGHSVRLKNCTSQKECPVHSICTKVEGKFQCICWQGYHQNPDWSGGYFDISDSDYYSSEPANKTVIVHNRLPAKNENLAVVILLVLFAVIVVTVVVYCLVVLRPISRTITVYRRLKLKRSNHNRLEEFYDIDMTFRDAHTRAEYA
ncbi:uncharacterized protein LOC116804871 [Drosophila mojavensis]|uniref:uncharacterized protein LOC116804871 n=1 Tax=Drosophila mojavensis TaxID=7230 RepID=UPI0013EE7C8E|nr:uncharacterized protein LOC116804871 [Drosophila mojavensis]